MHHRLVSCLNNYLTVVFIAVMPAFSDTQKLHLGLLLEQKNAGLLTIEQYLVMSKELLGGSSSDISTLEGTAVCLDVTPQPPPKKRKVVFTASSEPSVASPSPAPALEPEPEDSAIGSSDAANAAADAGVNASGTCSDSSQHDSEVEEVEAANLPTLKKKVTAKSFVKMFKQAPAKVDKKRTTQLNKPPCGKKTSKKKQGSRKADVKLGTLKSRPIQFPGETLEIKFGQLWCACCSLPVGSGKAATKQHVTSSAHKAAMLQAENNDTNAQEIRASLDEYIQDTIEETGCTVAGLDQVDVATQLFRADCLESLIGAGVEVEKVNKLRPFLERIGGRKLTQASKLQSTYLPPLCKKEFQKLVKEVKGQKVGVYHDGTTHSGEAFAIILRWVDNNMKIHLRAIKVSFLEGSLANKQISAELIQALAEVGVKLSSVFAFMNDSVAANITSFADTLALACVHSDNELCTPHTANHVGEAFDTPVLDEFMTAYNTCCSKWLS